MANKAVVVRAESIGTAVVMANQRVATAYQKQADRERRTQFVEVELRSCKAEEARQFVRWVAEVHPRVPKCCARYHDWVAVESRDHGRGAITTERCRSCGLLRTTDTWATCPASGVAGYTEIRYENMPAACGGP